MTITQRTDGAKKISDGESLDISMFYRMTVCQKISKISMLDHLKK